MPVDGPVVEKIRYNKSMQQIPAEEVNVEAGYTYFFVKIRQGDADIPVNVPRKVYAEVKIGDRLVKPAESEDFQIRPAETEP